MSYLKILTLAHLNWTCQCAYSYDICLVRDFYYYQAYKVGNKWLLLVLHLMSDNCTPSH